VSGKSIDCGNIVIGETLLLDGFFVDDSGAPANPANNEFRKSGAGLVGIDITNPPTQATDDLDAPIVGQFLIELTGTAAGWVYWDWKGSGGGVRPSARQGFVRVVKPGVT
jgi:hypothetical protein